jgi:hypothetical protein
LPDVAHLQSKLDRIDQHVAAAHRRHEAGEHRTACQEARLAAEGILRLLAELHEVDLGLKRNEQPTIESMRTPLSHKGVLDRAMQGRVSTIQTFANRAAHYQHDEDDDVTVDDAISCLAALRGLRGMLEGHERKLSVAEAEVEVEPTGPVTAARPRLTSVAFPLLLVPLVAAVSFLGALWALELTLGAAPPPPEPTPTAMPRVDDVLGAADEPELAPAQADEQVEPDAEPPVEQPSPTPPEAEPPPDLSAREKVAERVRQQVMPPNDELARLHCDGLIYARNWIWARHGYNFVDGPVREEFNRHPSYRAVTGRTATTIEPLLTETDRRLREAFDVRLKQKQCGCPTKIKPNKPCPL